MKKITKPFSKRDILFFVIALALVSIGYIFMAVDPVDNGFGVLTLWIAPLLLIVGFFLPIPAIIGFENVSKLISIKNIKEAKWKHLFGAFAFLLSFGLYIITLEPTASLWDCSEFIASAYKLQVPHTPGTPLSLLIGRLFSMLAFSDVTKVAWSINLMSAFFSAGAVFLVYHLIFYFGERLSLNQKNSTPLLIVGALCGSLTLAVSDTFWFSAVEAEIYGTACFFLLLLLWSIVKGKTLEQPVRSRVLIAIFYLSGLAYCIHPMCLLVLPVLPFAWYTHKRVLTLKNVLISTFLGLVIVFVINRLVAIGVFQLAFSFDLFLVNSLGLPFYSGAILTMALFIAAFIVALIKLPKYYAFTYATAFLILGFIPYIMLFIRSGHNPPIDETNPEDLAMIKAYMNRESYPGVPLLYGPYYDADIEKVNVKAKVYFKDAEGYKVAGTRPEYEYTKGRQTIFPRMFSRSEDHISLYRRWTDLEPDEKPRFSHNLKYFFRYQLGHMYMRYFMWNFSGREADVQDSAWLRPWKKHGKHYEGQRARNQYWMIPLLFGLVGAVFHYKKDRKGFIANAIFFLITGLILAFYLNAPPQQPRERDYIFVGSYIAFAIWLGLGVLAIGRLSVKTALVIACALAIIIPSWMLYQNFDDHDRSGRTFQVDHARNILSSCAPDAVLFTGGDNDTFPLWYLQEVEGFRTDVRVMVLSYFNTDWYINQLRRPYYDSKPFELTLTEDDYRQYGPNDVIYISEEFDQPIDMAKYIELLTKEHPGLKRTAPSGEVYHILPSKTVSVCVEDKHLQNTPVTSNQSAIVEKAMTFKTTKNYLEKNTLAILDLVISNDWQRPVYFNMGAMRSVSVDFKPYLVQEGLIFRLSPVRSANGDVQVDLDKAYTNLVDNAVYDNLQDDKVYFNYEDYQARMITPTRQALNTLALHYYNQNEHGQALKVLNASWKKLHFDHLKPSYTYIQMAALLSSLGEKEQAKSVAIDLFEYSYGRLNEDQKGQESQFNLYYLAESARLLYQLGETKYAERANALNSRMQSVSAR